MMEYLKLYLIPLSAGIAGAVGSLLFLKMKFSIEKKKQQETVNMELYKMAERYDRDVE